MLLDAMIMFFWLMFGHCLADYPLQGNFLSTLKRRKPPYIGPGLWVIGLPTHACIHAGSVLFFTQSPLLCALEFVTHAAIDFTKCEGHIGFRTDQALHVACKVTWVAMLWYGIA
jgi:hypothetical protein